MKKMLKLKRVIVTGSLAFIITACGIPKVPQKQVENQLPENYTFSSGSVSSASLPYDQFFTDSVLVGMIRTGLNNNMELNIFLQRIAIANNEIRARKGEYLPQVGVGAGSDLEKVGEYTSEGAVEEGLEVMPGEEFPKPLGNFEIGLFSSWEVDIWKKLRNARKSAVMEYLATVEGKNFLVTNLIAEIAKAYYELLALDNQLLNLEENIKIQKDALEIVRLLKKAGRTNELAVMRFEAEVKKNQSEIFLLKQQIVEVQNELNFLTGKAPQEIKRDSDGFLDMKPAEVQAGLPSQLLENRTDIRRAEYELAAAQLNVKVAKADFYPRLDIRAGLGYQAFNAKFVLNTPESMVYTLAGELMAPVINRNAIKAAYMSANAVQIQAVYEYQMTVLNAYREVVNQLSKIDNLEQTFQLKSQQVDALTESIKVSTLLFQSARADYMEVLLTQRDALEAKLELIEVRKTQFFAIIDLYRSLGGGWKQ